MDINKNQQVNTFLKGMNTDISDALIDNSQYRYAENIRVTTKDEHNTGEVRLIEGNTPIHDFGIDKHIIYMNSIRDYVVVICANGTTSWSVYVNDNKGVEDLPDHPWKLIFGPCEDLLWDSLDTVAISGVMRYESVNNIKLYITDNTREHVIIPILIDRQHWKLTPDVELKTLTGYQDTFLDAPTATVLTDAGHLKPAKVQYIYRLYKAGGAATTLSPAGNVLSLYKSDNEGYTDKEVTNKATSVTIKFHDVTGLDRILLFRITYMYNGQTPTVHRIEDKVIDVSKGYVEIRDYGDNKEELGIDELLSLTLMQIKPKLLESKGDTLFAANIKYVQDDVDKTFENYDTRAFSSGNYWDISTLEERPLVNYEWDETNAHWNQTVNDSTQVPISFTIAGDNEEHGGRLNQPIDGAVLCHRQFNSGDIPYNAKYWKPIAEAASGTGIADLTYNVIGGKGENISWRLETETVSLSNQGKSVTDNRHFYKCDETYRFGAILYNDEGQSSSVKWICDIRIPPRKEMDYTFTGEGQCTVKTYKPVFWIKNWPEGCKAIQIVQCPRRTDDRHVITQGIVGFPMRMKDNNGEDTNYICPSGLMTLQRIYAKNYGLNISGQENTLNVGDDGVLNRSANSTTDVILFASPEYAYQSDDIKNILKTYSNQISLQHVIAYDIYSDRTLDIIDGYLVYPKTSDTYSNERPYGTGFGYKKSNYGNVGDYLEVNYTITGYGADAEGGNDGNHANSTGFNQNALSTIIGDKLSANRSMYDKKLILKKFSTANRDNSWTWGYLAFNHIIPKSVCYYESCVPTYPQINSMSYPTVPTWDLFADGENIRFNDDVTAVSSDSYINWTYPLCLDSNTGSDSNMAKCLKDTGSVQNIHGRAGFLYPIGTGGKCIVMKLNGNVTFSGQNTTDGYLYPSQANGTMAPIHIANIVKPCTPYGGYSPEAIQNSTYYGHGNLITETDFVDNVTYPLTVDAKGGDSYMSFFKYNAAHLWYDPTYIAATKQATVYEVPVETDMDIDADYGTKYSSSTNLGYYIQDEAASLPGNSGGYSQDKPSYQYNTAYNQSPNVITYSSVEKTDISNYDWDVRIHNSELKTNGENIDSWLTFKALNYLDVDSRNGEITELKLFKDRLMFWLDDAVGVLSSNERTMLNDASGNQIILGNGGILQRSDYISTTYGMKKGQFADTQSNTTLYWWDGNNKEILAYTENGLLPLGSLKAVRNYLNERQETEHPFLFYDIENKEVVCSVVKNLENPSAGESLVYSEQIEAFSSIYKFAPLYGTELSDQVLTTNDTQLYKQNETTGNASTLFGQSMLPKLQYTVNAQNMFPKVFDIQTFGGRFYGGDKNTVPGIDNLRFDYKTPLKQHSTCTGTAVTNREYDFRLDIPRNNNDVYGGRMRGKTMECEFSSTSNSTDFSLQYIVTKYRMSWS